MTLFPNKIFVWKDFLIADRKKNVRIEKTYNKWSCSLTSINQYFVVFMFREIYSFICSFKRTKYAVIQISSGVYVFYKIGFSPGFGHYNKIAIIFFVTGQKKPLGRPSF